MPITRASFVPILAVVLAACGCAQPVSPAAITVFGSHTVSGAVTQKTSAGAAPIVGAIVREAITNQTVTTDHRGRYSIGGIRDGLNVAVVVSKVGFLTANVSQTISDDTEIDVQLDPRPTYVLSGVISEMTPAGLVGIPGVDVYFASYVGNIGGAKGSDTTDDQGRYRLAGLWGEDAVTGIWLAKQGYLTDGDPLCDYCYQKLAIKGDTALDIQLERLQATPTYLRGFLPHAR